MRAFARALQELHAEGGVQARHARYSENHRELVDGMTRLGFSCLLEMELRSPIITSFLEPSASGYSFACFYAALKERGFVIYVSRHHPRAHFYRLSIDELVGERRARPRSVPGSGLTGRPGKV